MKKEEFFKLKEESRFKELPLMDYIYFIPLKEKHDSGYNLMMIVAENREGYKKIVAYSDVIMIEQIITNRKQYNTLSIDIPCYGVIRLFSRNKFKINYYGISTFSFDLVEVE